MLLTIITIMGFAGAALMFKRNRPAFWPLTIQITVYPPVYYLTQNFPRYRYPILWVSFLFAAYGLSVVWKRIARSA